MSLTKQYLATFSTDKVNRYGDERTGVEHLCQYHAVLAGYYVDKDRMPLYGVECESCRADVEQAGYCG